MERADLAGQCSPLTADADFPVEWGCPLLADFVAKVGSNGLGRWAFVESRGFDAAALTLFTQLRRYAMHGSWVGGGRATSVASRRRF
jgi:hypothetical protein